MNHSAQPALATAGNNYTESRKALFPTYAPPTESFTRGEGCYLFNEGDEQGYLDFFSGIAVCALGHSHPALVKTLREQAGNLWHVSNALRVPQGEALSSKLAQLAGLDRVFFTNSGTESVECGLKMMRRYHFDQGHPERERIIGVNHAFHGRTHGGICAAGNPAHTKGFVGKDERFDHVPFNDIAALEAAITPHTAGIIMETVQGEGGIYPAKPEYLKRVRELCDQHGIFLMLDEVQCGVGRTGTFFAYEHYGIKPDVVASAKGLGGGFPVGACIASEKLASAMVVGTHGSTYGGNPLAMAVAAKVVELIANDSFMENVTKQSDALHSELNALVAEFPDVLKEVRGMGLMIGIECIPKDAYSEIVKIAREHKLLITKAGSNTLRLLPPLIIGDAEVKEAITKLRASVADYQSQHLS